jgi:hypothetical protein
LSPLEDCLIDAFSPPLNFRPKQVTITEQPCPHPGSDCPPEIGAKVQQLLTSGFSSLDILNTLELLSQTQTAVKPLPKPLPEPLPQTDAVILQHLKTLTQSMSALQQQVHSRITALEEKVKQSRPLEDESRPVPKKEPEPKCLQGTAALDEIPKHPENTHNLAKRWGITDKVLTRQRLRYLNRPDGFFQYSLKKEQGKFGWIYDTKNQLYYALTELPSSVHSTPTATATEAIASPNQPTTPTPAAPEAPPDAEAIPKALPSPLTAAQLGQRFISPKTGQPISAKGIERAINRHDPDSFAQYCRQRDPNGFAWTLRNSDKLFVCIG